MKNAKIGHFEHQKSGCLWYRILRPMDFLASKGYEVESVTMNQDVDIDNMKSFQLYGAYPFSCELVLKLFKEKNIKIVYDMDDALGLVEEHNPFYYSVKKDVGSVQQILDYADEVTVSMPIFKEYLQGRTKAKITVVPNSYNPAEWIFPRPKRDGIRIGFAGASPHVSDLIEIIPVIKKLQDKYNVKFLIMGFGKEDYRTWYKEFRYVSTPQGVEQLEKLDKALGEIVFEWVPFVDFERYPATLTNMALDIGICPLKPTPFNNHRSACKAMEYTLSGALALASDTIPYRTEPTSILVQDNEWEQALTYYIENPDARKMEHAFHLEWLKENRDINNPEYLELLEKIYIK